MTAGYASDIGRSYASRGGGLTYGWNVDNTPNAVDRNSPKSPSEPHDAFVSMGDRQWQIAVPNGRYRVFLAVGDASRYDTTYGVRVEGSIIAQHQPSASEPWIEQQTSLSVSDGVLTLRKAPGAGNNKLAFIHIQQIA
jgi:hypothetical protein